MFRKRDMTLHVGTESEPSQCNKHEKGVKRLTEEIHVSFSGEHAFVPRGTDNSLQLRIRSFSCCYRIGVELRVKYCHAHRKLLPLLVLRVHHIHEIAVATPYIAFLFLQPGVRWRTDEEDRVRPLDVHALEILVATTE